MKTQADKLRRDVEFKVGDAVCLKLRPYRMRSLAWRLNEKLGSKFLEDPSLSFSKKKKLGSKFFGPYVIMKGEEWEKRFQFDHFVNWGIIDLGLSPFCNLKK